MPLLTLEDAKEQLSIPASTTTHDAELQDFVDAAARVVENHLHEAIELRNFTEQHSVRSGRPLVLAWTPVDSIISVTSLDGLRSWDPVDLQVSESGVVRAVRGPVFSGDIEVVYRAGYTTPPPNYNLAGRIIVQHLWQTQRSGARPGGVLADSFQNTVGGGRGYAIPNAALQLLGESGPVFA